MAHKHKRRQKDGDDTHDLPPTTIAKPLPTKAAKIPESKNGGQDGKAKKSKDKKKSRGKEYQDDTPKAFARMMMQIQNPRNLADGPRKPLGLDDGTPREKKQGVKRKRGAGEDSSSGAPTSSKRPEQKRPAPQTQSPKPTPTSLIPKILPGERMADFSARVDQALPLSGISKRSATSSTGKDPVLSKLREGHRTKHEKRLRRLQRDWRVEEARIREREEAEREEREEENEEADEIWKQWEEEAGKTKKKKKTTKKNKKKKNLTGADEGDVDSDSSGGDPWEKLNRRKKAAHASRPTNPFEVVQAPPEQLVKPREKFKVRGMGGARVDVADVPTAAGSLRRREELAGERQSIVEQYRKLMAQKRG
ncbi:hypothetical protein AJ80_06375 [Polytolypa hystricis UAMH7299]|uniref:Urease accessory protein UreD n=1 Tax=Polytolypa hystricis (strain UAMH7299) TaxID=1447883 RepID=A0A2B7XVN9_POLH7|nr:hypothetical protein AJ80_06375 [Polytolypa hystricis UAMH7299]